ncbi:SOS response-associated peptidase family protein, partial [Burkholderia gladioli]
MCTHYRAPNEPEELNQFRLPLLGPLYEREPWKHIKYRIGLAGWRPFCIAGVWRAWKEPDGTESIAMAMLTVNADEHEVMKHMHRPGDEKRSVVILKSEDHDEWLHAENVEMVRSLLNLDATYKFLFEPAQ